MSKTVATCIAETNQAQNQPQENVFFTTHIIEHPALHRSVFVNSDLSSQVTIHEFARQYTAGTFVFKPIVFHAAGIEAFTTEYFLFDRHS